MSVDAQINFGNTVSGSSALPAGVNVTNFYARWVGYLIPSVTGVYTIGVNSDDGANLLIGGQPIVSNLSASQPANSTLAYTQSGTINLTAGVYYELILEWQQGGGSYECQLIWTPPGGSIQLIPSANLSTASNSITGNLKGAWWNGTSLFWFPIGGGATRSGFAGAWSSTVGYVPGDEVTYTGSFWKSLLTNINSAPTLTNTNWQNVGATVVGLAAYNGSTAYYVTNQVTYNGNVYQCIAATTGNLPTNATYWTLVGPATLDSVIDGSTYLRQPGTAGAEGLVENGSFTSGLSGWSLNAAGVAAVTGYGPLTGSQYAQWTGTQWSNIQSLRKFSCLPGDVYYVVGWIYQYAANSAEIGLAQYQGNATWIGSTAVAYSATTGSWVYVSGQITIPANCAYFYVYCSQSAAGTYQVNFTGVQVYLVRSLDNGVAEGTTFNRTLAAMVNLVPDSDFCAPTIYWPGTGGSGFSWDSSYPGVLANGPCFIWGPGTGSAAANAYKYSRQIAVVPGRTYTLSGYIDAGSVTSGSPVLAIYNTGLSTAYAYVGQVAGQAGRVSATFTVPGGVTQVVCLLGNATCTVSVGGYIYWMQPQLVAGSNKGAYVSSDGDYLSGTGLIDFSHGSHTNKILDNIGDGSTYRRPLYVNADNTFHVSTALNKQGSVVPNQPLTTPVYTSATTSITLSAWSSQTMTLADGTVVTVAAGGPLTYSGLSSSTTYYFYPAVRLSDNTIQYLQGSPPPTSRSAAAAIAASSDGYCTMLAFSVTTPASGSGGGGGGYTCPASTELVNIQGKGQIQAGQVQYGDLIEGYSFQSKTNVFRKVTNVRSESCAAWRIVNGHKVTPCEPIYDGANFTPAFKVSGAVFDGSVGTKTEITVASDDYDECNYWLVSGTQLLTHNIMPGS
jgi:PA14 domain